MYDDDDLAPENRGRNHGAKNPLDVHDGTERRMTEAAARRSKHRSEQLTRKRTLVDAATADEPTIDGASLMARLPEFIENLDPARPLAPSARPWRPSAACYALRRRRLRRSVFLPTACRC